MDTLYLSVFPMQSVKSLSYSSVIGIFGLNCNVLFLFYTVM